ncbi:MAG: CRISPR-associated RAMP family protein [Pauljensenia sp.]
MSTFHYAYNGISTKRSEEPCFKDRVPDSLDHLAPGTYSGTLKLTIKTKTPLITAWRDSNGRLVIPSASGKAEGANNDTDVIIPATSLKGVLSSAYEAVTQSRFRVFGDDQRQAQFRYTPDHPQSWQNNGIPPWKTGFLRVTPGDNGPQWSIHLQQCALLPDSIDAGVAFTPPGFRHPILGGFHMVKRGQGQEKTRIEHSEAEETAVENMLTTLRQHTPHLSKVTSFEAFKQQRHNKSHLIVSKVNNIALCESRSPDKHAPTTIECNGYIVRLTKVPDTGELKLEDRLMATKYNEYIFYTDKGTPKAKPIQLDINSPFVAIVLKAVRIASNPATNKGARHTLIDKAIQYIERKGDEGKVHKKITPENIYEFLLDEAVHEPGIPLFARKRSKGEWELAFSQLGRSATPGSLSPSQLAKKGNINPARSIAETSAADRLWGFAAQDPADSVSPALKGRIYLTNARLLPKVGTTHLQRSRTGEGWIPPTLAEPKPWTAQPYLRRADGSGIFETERSECFTDQHALIRKTYPTHRFLLASGGRSVLNRKGTPSQLPGSELLIGSYVKAGAVFESTLRFEGLSARELSVILWLLNPEMIVPNPQRAEGECGFFHLGLGKPLGLGTVCIRGEVLTLIASESLASSYRDLKGVLSLEETTGSGEEQRSLAAELASVTEALPSTISKQTSLAVRAFVRSAYGWKGDGDERRDPVSYSPPAFCPKKQGLSPIISYFTEYEKSRIKDQEFTFKMQSLEEDSKDSVSQSSGTTGRGSLAPQGSNQPTASDTSSKPVPRPKAPTPGSWIH